MHINFIPPLIFSTTLVLLAAPSGVRAEPRWTRWAWGPQADTEATVWWEDDQRGEAWVEAQKPDGSVAKTPASVTTCYEKLDPGKLGCTFRCALKELAGSTNYRFRPYSGGKTGAWITLSTPPAAEQCRPLSLVVMSDTRGKLELPVENPWTISSYWPRLMKLVLSEKPAAVLHLGDVVAEGKQAFFWRDWLKASVPFLARTAFLTAVGNHDFRPESPERDFFRRLLAPPSDSPGLTWATRAGATLVIALDTESTPVSKQLGWLERTLKDNEDKVDWRIVIAHRPVFSSGYHGSNHENKYPVEKLVPMLEKYRVDLFIAGHDHNYERFHPLSYDPGSGAVTEHPLQNNSKAPAEGPVYLTVGGGGAPTAEIFSCKAPGCAKFSSNLHYLVLDVLGNRLEAAVRDLGVYGQPESSLKIKGYLDRFMLYKPGARCGKLVGPRRGRAERAGAKSLRKKKHRSKKAAAKAASQLSARPSRFPTSYIALIAAVAVIAIIILIIGKLKSKK